MNALAKPCSVRCDSASPPSRPRWPGPSAPTPQRPTSLVRRPLWPWAMWSCLLMLLAGCASPPATITPTALPANLAQPCDPGPPIPAADVRLAELLEVWAQRELAAAECRDRVARLQRAWPR